MTSALDVDAQEALGNLYFSLLDGDLTPLAQYLRAGRQIDGEISQLLADMIDDEGRAPSDGRTAFRIQAVGRTTGETGWKARRAAFDRKMEIGVWVLAETEGARRGEQKGIVLQASERFGQSERTIENHRRFVKEFIAKADTQPGFDLWDMLKNIYCDPSA